MSYVAVINFIWYAIGDKLKILGLPINFYTGAHTQNITEFY